MGLRTEFRGAVTDSSPRACVIDKTVVRFLGKKRSESANELPRNKPLQLYELRLFFLFLFGVQLCFFNTGDGRSVKENVWMIVLFSILIDSFDNVYKSQ